MSATKDNSLTEQILSKNIWKLMVQLSIPSILGMSVNGINAFVDALFVGQFLGEAALAAISLAFPLTMITNGFSAMIGVGASSLLSIAIGSKDLEIQRKTFGTLTLLSIIVSIILTFLGIYFAYDLVAFLGGENEVLELGATYYQIMMAGTILRLFGVAANMLMRSEGKVKESMLMMAVATGLNIILNPIFIGYFEWGIAGAAWATVVSMGAFTLLGIWYYASGRTSYPVDLKTYSLEAKLTVPILKVGVSAMMVQIMFFIQQVVVFKSITYYGGDDGDRAFMGAMYRILILLVLPCFGFAAALQPVLGINFGAKNFARVKKAFHIFTISNVVFIVFTWLLGALFPEVILGWMLPNTVFSEQDIFNYQIFLITLPIVPIFYMGSTFFQSIGDAQKAGILVAARELILFVPITLVLPIYYGIPGIYYVSLPVNLIAVSVAIWWVRRAYQKWD